MSEPDHSEHVEQDRLISAAALPDDRPAAARARDYRVDEILTSSVIPFKNTRPLKPGATLYNQWYVGSCVPHGFYTQLEYEKIVPPAPHGMSQLRAYRKRSNYPQAGSIGVNIYDMIKKGQSTNSEAATKPYMTEEEATAMPYVIGTKLISDFDYLQFVDPSGATDVSRVPAEIAGGKAVAIFIFATEEEWSQKWVSIKDPNLNAGNAYVRHCVCLMPKGDFTEDGKQWLAVQDSAAFGGRHLRYVHFEFLKKRCYFASMVTAKPDEPEPEPVPPTPTKPVQACKLNDRGDHVTVLQKYLSERKYLDAQYVTGFYGQLTAKAVLWWQLFYHDKFEATIPALLTLKGESFGPQSLEVVALVP